MFIFINPQFDEKTRKLLLPFARVLLVLSMLMLIALAVIAILQLFEFEF